MSLSQVIDLSTERARGYTDYNFRGIAYLGYDNDDEFRKVYAQVPKSSTIQISSYYYLWLLAKQCLSVEGDFWECGVFAGGSAKFLSLVMNGADKTLHLFDSWEGLPELSDKDHIHFKGEFSNCSLEEVKKTVNYRYARYHKGWIPKTFFDNQIAFAHIDVDLYQSVKDCCEYIYPRMTKGGVMVFDDYGHYTTMGAREAVDEFFKNKPENPIPVINGQAFVFKL